MTKNTIAIPTAEELDQKRKAAGLEKDNNIGTRIYRAVSWLKCAEKYTEDPDAKFIFLWISFNAAYGKKFDNDKMYELKKIRIEFEQLTGMDDEQLLFNVLLEASESIRKLMENQYVFKFFWEHHNTWDAQETWGRKFDRDRKDVEQALEKNDTQTVLINVLPRLYELRNQLIHGGATWNGSKNREQVQDGSNLLSKIVPLVIQILISKSKAFIGEANYPIIETP